MTNSVDSKMANPQANNGSYKPNYVTSVMRDALFGAAAGYGITYLMPTIQEDEFVKKGVQVKGTEEYLAQVNSMKEKTATLTKEMEGITDATAKAAKSKEVAKVAEELASFEKDGVTGYFEKMYPAADSGSKNAHKLETAKELLREEFKAHGEKKLGTIYKEEPKAMETVKKIFSEIKKEKAKKTAVIGAVFCGLAGVITSMLTARMVKKAERAKEAQG